MSYSPHEIQVIADSSITAHQVIRTTTSGHVTPATTNLRTIPFLGLAISSASSSAPVYIQTNGLLSSGIFNLGDGYACVVGVNASSNPIRATDPTCVSAPNWLGYCDVHGTITIRPECKLYFDPKDYGCPMNGLNDDYPGFRILLDSLPPFPNHRGVEIRIPNGEMWFSQSVRIDRPVHIRGGSIGGGDAGDGTNINFAPGYGFIIEDYRTGTNHNNGKGSTIGRCIIKSKQLIPANPAFGGLYWTDTRYPSTAYALGDIVIPYNAIPTRINTKKCFRVTQQGTTASTPANGTDPTGFSTAVTGTVIVDGTLIWTCEALPDDYTSYATPNTPASGAKHYLTGDRVFIVGDTRLFWQAQNDGYTAGNGINPLDGVIVPWDDTITDGYVVWAKNASAAILCKTGNCNFEHLYIFGFTGYAIFVEGDGGLAPLNIADFGLINNVHFMACGGGITFKGFDAQGWTVLDSEGTIEAGVSSGMRTIKNSTISAGAHGFYDASLGNTYTGCYFQGDGGVGFYVPVNTGSTFVGCRSESVCNDIITAGNFFISGNSAVGISGTGHTIISGVMRNLVFGDYAGVQTRSGGIKTDAADAHNVSLWFSNTEADYLGQYSGFWGWVYQGAPTLFGNGASGTGWQSFGYDGPYNGGQRAVGISGPITSQGVGPGHWRLYSGQFIGTEVVDQGYGAGLQYRGVDGLELAGTRIRGGQRLLGDKFAVQSTGAPGTWDEYVVQVAVVAAHIG